MNNQFKQHDLTSRIQKNKRALYIEILCTIAIAILVVVISLSNIEQQAGSYADGVEADYNLLMTEYVRVFDTACQQICEKIESDLSFEEMDSWLKSMDKKWAMSMGEEVYDGIAFTYKGGFARSWSYGDYSDYDPTTRNWYKVAEAANGETVFTEPYVTYMDAQFDNDGSWILMSIVKKYDDEIYFDYDIKHLEIRELMENRRTQYKNTGFLLFTENGCILSCNDSAQYAHNLFEPDDVISEGFSGTIQKGLDYQDNMRLVEFDGALRYLYLTQSDSGIYVAVIIPFESVFMRDFFAITLIVIFLLSFEAFLYRRNRQSLLEYQYRDERLSAVTNAAFRGRVYIDIESGSFYGNKEAEELIQNGVYSDLFEVFCTRIIEESHLQPFRDFLSPEALAEASKNPYHMETRKFPMQWKMPDGTYQPRTVEVGRLASEIDGRATVALLCRDVSEDAKILQEALKQAESASRAKGDFMSHMSHEIRTPLNAITGYLDIAQSERDDPEKVDHCLEQSRVAARHLLSIVNDVLDISSIESGRMKIADEDFDLRQLVDSLTTIFYAQASKKGLHFEVGVSGLTDEWLRGDSLRVNQILLNLLSNAVKFTPEGGTVRLDIYQVGIHENKVHLQFKVTDTGIGMSKEYLNRIFKPFEQESASTARNYGGTGLGLSISFNLVKMMGGTIEVESEQGKGTEFTVMLAFGQAQEQHKEHPGTESFSNLKALVVDDEEDACEYIQKLLERCGVKCDTVTSGKKALRRVKTRLESGSPYDFCIVDWNMPEMNGIDTAKQIRELCGKEMPIIIATAYDYSAIEDEAKQAGVNKIVSKPLFQSTVFDMLVNTYGKYKPAKSEDSGKKSVNFEGMRIILAEDNPMNMEIAVDILTKAGMVISQAANGKEALDKFTGSPSGSFDAILMDIQMPVMDGYEAARAIRKSAHPQAKTIPIIAMTANAFTSDVTEALAAGMNDHVSKPISYDRLFAALSKVIAKGETGV